MNKAVYDNYAILGWPCHFLSVKAVEKYNAKIERYCKVLNEESLDLSGVQKVLLWFYVRFLIIFDLFWSFGEGTP